MSAPEMAFRVLDRLRLIQDKRQPPRFDVPVGINRPFSLGRAQGAWSDLIPEWRAVYENARD
ncbi:MAG TPA: hypothetical protein VH722_13045, partial [Alphaproteobacteria bacterium]|nr:hypothetical protein [Alphaproteobacteria bacterium]